MEDEEYYHMMMSDLERLERIHHHRNHLHPGEPENPPPSPPPRSQPYHWNPSYFDSFDHHHSSSSTTSLGSPTTPRFGTTTTISSAASTPGAESGSGSGSHRPPSPILAGLKGMVMAGLDVLHLHHPHHSQSHRPGSAHSHNGEEGSGRRKSKDTRRNSSGSQH